MTVQTFRDLLTQRPFRPFRLVMSSGQTFEVRATFVNRRELYQDITLPASTTTLEFDYRAAWELFRCCLLRTLMSYDISNDDPTPPLRPDLADTPVEAPAVASKP